MSVLEDLQQAQQRVIDRLNELEPLAAEYEHLRNEASRLGLAAGSGEQSVTSRSGGKSRRGKSPAAATSGEPSSSSASKPSAARKSAKAPGSSAARTANKRRAGGSRGPSGGRANDVLRVIAQRPGVTVKEVGDELGVNPTGLYAPVRKLVKDGQVKKSGAKLEPVKG